MVGAEPFDRPGRLPALAVKRAWVRRHILRECDPAATEGKGAAAGPVDERNERKAGERGRRLVGFVERAEYLYVSNTYRAAFEARYAAAAVRREAQGKRSASE